MGFGTLGIEPPAPKRATTLLPLGGGGAAGAAPKGWAARRGPARRVGVAAAREVAELAAPSAWAGRNRSSASLWQEHGPSHKPPSLPQYPRPGHPFATHPLLAPARQSTRVKT